MVSKNMMEQGSIVQELDAEVYRMIAGALASKQLEMETTIEIQRKKREGQWLIELWSKEPEKAKRAIKEVVGELRFQDIAAPKPKPEHEREPLIDVSDRGDYLSVVTELPGLEESDIILEVKTVLKISVNAKNRQYNKEVLLPEHAKIMDKTYKNNILEVKLKKEVKSKKEE